MYFSLILKMLLSRLVLLVISRCYHSLLKQILRFDHWEYLISWVRSMLDALDEANIPPEDANEATELVSSSIASAMSTSILHTKLGSPKPETTLEEFMQVSTGPGNPLPRTFRKELEIFLNNFYAANQLPYTEYLKVRGEDKVMGFISIMCGLLTQVW